MSSAQNQRACIYLKVDDVVNCHQCQKSTLRLDTVNIHYCKQRKADKSAEMLHKHKLII